MQDLVKTPSDKNLYQTLSLSWLGFSSLGNCKLFGDEYYKQGTSLVKVWTFLQSVRNTRLLILKLAATALEWCNCVRERFHVGQKVQLRNSWVDNACRDLTAVCYIHKTEFKVTDTYILGIKYAVNKMYVRFL